MALSRPVRTLALALALLWASAMSGCGGGESGLPPCDEACALDFFANRTAIVVTPASSGIVLGTTFTADVLLVEPVNSRHGAGYSSNADYYTYQIESLRRGEADESGVQTSITLSGGVAPCDPFAVPAAIRETGTEYLCRHAVLTLVTTTAATRLGRISIEAEWTQSTQNAIIPLVRTATVRQTGFFSPQIVQSDFVLGIAPLAKVYATRGFVTVTVDRRYGFAEPVQLSFDGFLSGITGTFTPNPVPPGVDHAQLRLDVPASLAGGTSAPLKVLGTGGGIDRSFVFGQIVEPLYTVKLATADGGPAVLTPLRPLDLEVTIDFDPYGPFSLIGPGRIQLTLPDPPPDVVAEFLPDAQPGSLAPPVFPAALVYRRTLRLTGPRIETMDDLRVRATAVQLSPDFALQQPFVEAKLLLRLDPSQSWDYVNSGATYFLNDNDAIGIGMQSNNQPAIAWLEGGAGSKAVYLKRFDGAVFAPSPFPGGPGTGLAVAGGGIEQARMAMSGSDVAHVAFTYTVNTQEGARVGLGSAGAAWSVHDELSSLPPAQHARSPRIAAGRNDSLALSYLVETGIPAGAGSLFVRGRLASGALAARPGPRLDASINVADSGQVLRDTPSLALRADGNPWLAWIEQPFHPVTLPPPALWLRGHDGTRWGAPIPVPTRRPLVAAPTQLLVTQTGRLIVAWFEASPARLMLAYVDPLTGVPTELRDPVNADGALNYTTDEPAREAALALDSSGRLVVTWTEGLTVPSLYAKRLNADGTWARLGTAIDTSRPTQSPFVTSDAAGRLYVAWTGFFAGTDAGSPAPKTDVLVGRWNFP